MILWLIQRTRGFRGRLILSVFLGSLTIFSSIGLFGASAYLIATAAYQPSIAVLQVAIVGVRLFGISRSVFRYLERLVTHSANLKLLSSIRTWIFDNLLKKYPVRDAELSNTDVLTSIIHAVDVLENFYVRLLSPIIVAVIVSISTALFFGLFSLELLLIIMLGLGLTGFGLPWLAGNAGALTAKKTLKKRFVYEEAINVYISSYQELSVLQAADGVVNHLNGLEIEWAKQKRDQNVLQALFSGLSFLSTQGVFLLVLVVTAGLVLNGSIDAVMMAVLSLITLASFEAVINLPVSAQFMGDIRAAGNRIRKLQAKPTTNVQKTETEITSFQKLELKKLKFRYLPDSDYSLDDINLILHPGEKIAVVGESGSGKTTLLNILLGFYHDYEGDFLLNGISGKVVSEHTKRTIFSAVSASPYFFRTSLLQNFQLANPIIESNTVQDLLSRVGLTQVAEKRQQSFDAMMNDDVNYSSGELQRLDLARAMVRQADVYLFDEPTANLDSLLSTKIIEEIFSLLKNKSVIFVTHNYLLMDKFDEIIVLKKGQIVERGTHQALLHLNGYYSELYYAHFPEFSYYLSH